MFLDSVCNSHERGPWHTQSREKLFYGRRHGKINGKSMKLKEGQGKEVSEAIYKDEPQMRVYWKIDKREDSLRRRYVMKVNKRGGNRHQASLWDSEKLSSNSIDSTIDNDTKAKSVSDNLNILKLGKYSEGQLFSDLHAASALGVGVSSINHGALIDDNISGLKAITEDEDNKPTPSGPVSLQVNISSDSISIDSSSVLKAEVGGFSGVTLVSGRNRKG